jgi:acetyl-CoA carboxylase carboxyltransferase component
VTWQPEIDELRKREELGRRMGGVDKIKRHHDGGKLTVRERVAGILDEGSFHEIGAITGKTRYDQAGELIDMVPTNLVMGRGRINGRPVVITGDDFTVRGGANDGGLREKLERAEMMAYELRLPMVRLVDGTGGGGSVKNIEQDGRTQIPTVAIWDQVVKNMSVVPVVSLALGSVAGLGSARGAGAPPTTRSW